MTRIFDNGYCIIDLGYLSKWKGYDQVILQIQKVDKCTVQNMDSYYWLELG